MGRAGFGFISIDGGEQDVYFHLAARGNQGAVGLFCGHEVDFNLVYTNDGRPQAFGVRQTHTASRKSHDSGGNGRGRSRERSRERGDGGGDRSRDRSFHSRDLDDGDRGDRDQDRRVVTDREDRGDRDQDRRMVQGDEDDGSRYQ
ncbi:hypothetical protein T484DRAFT_1757454, partial [Baffinella frigidus]